MHKHTHTHTDKRALHLTSWLSTSKQQWWMCLQAGSQPKSVGSV